MTDESDVGFTPEENAAWAEMSGQPAPKIEEPEEDDAAEVEADEADTDEPDVEEAETEAEKPRSKTVPHKALHAERKRRQEVEAELQRQREQMAVLNDRWATLQRMQEAAAKEAEAPPVDDDPEPDPNQDIFAHNAWLRRQLLKDREERSKTEAERRQHEELQAAERQVWGKWEADRQTYATQNDAFGDAATFMASLRDKQLEIFGVADKRQRDQMINEELKQVVIAAGRKAQELGQPVNSAEVIYNLAVAAGFDPASRKSAETQAAQAAPVPDMPEKLAKTEQAKAASKSLSQAGGRSAPSEVTLEELANMPNDEFERWFAKPANEKRFRQMMGG